LAAAPEGTVAITPKLVEPPAASAEVLLQSRVRLVCEQVHEGSAEVFAETPVSTESSAIVTVMGSPASLALAVVLLLMFAV
jgi:hypothetical protein